MVPDEGLRNGFGRTSPVSRTSVGNCRWRRLNDDFPAAPAMISCRVATWRAKAPRPAAVAVTVVCGFLPTKALSTAT